jgi:ABC-type amino acid transport system permease subunit
MSKNKLLNIPAKIYISILRGTPVLVILMIIFYVVFASVNINPIIVATIAFGMNCGAYAAEIFRSGIEGIESGLYNCSSLRLSSKDDFRTSISTVQVPAPEVQNGRKCDHKNPSHDSEQQCSNCIPD